MATAMGVYLSTNVTVKMQEIMGTCGPVDRVLDLKSEGLGFDSRCWSCVVVSRKLLIQYCL